MTSALRAAIDHTALGWVKPEIDETLRQARLEIEAFAESPGDSERMRACAGHLHQVRGTLRMLELQAPSMVAEEMEQLAQALAADGVSDRDDACAALMRGVVQLPDYLERLQGGHRDIPIVLLPLLNDLRGVRGVAAIQQSALPGLLFEPTEAELEHARGSLAGRNRALLDTVSTALKEDLLRVKDALDLHLRAGLADVEGLQSQAQALDRIGETLGMLGLDAARTVIVEQRRVIQGIASGERPANENDLLDVAGALIYIDHSLDAQVARLGHDDAGSAESEDLVQQESRKVMGVLAKEATANFAEVRNAVVAFVETDWNHAALEHVPRLLGEVSGAMRILQLPEPAGYLEALRRYSQVELIGKAQVPGGRTLDMLADALAAMEYYLESLREPHGQRQDLLDKTRDSLEALGYWPLPDSTREQLADDAAVAAAAAPAPAPAPAAAAAPVREPGAAKPELTDVPTLPAVVAMQDSTPALSAGFDSVGDEIDDEIREIFLEEVEEEVLSLGQLLPAWRRSPDDGELLLPIRRAFHTLKGSGRLVGANALGEFSWHVENMLNRVLDGSRPASPAVTGFIAQACDVLPQLLSALRGEARITVDLAAMQAVADRLGTGEEVLLEGVPSAGQQPASPVSSVDDPAGSIDMVATHVDPVLLEILEIEVGGHLETVHAWLRQARFGQATVTDALLRAFHTLNGAFAMTAVPTVIAFTAPAEAYVKRLMAAGTEVSAAGIAVISDVAEAVRASTLALQATPSHVPVYAALVREVVALRDALPEAAPPFVTGDYGYDAERAAVQQAEQIRAAAQEAEAERLEAERVAAEQVEAERVAAYFVEEERAAAVQAEAGRRIAEANEAMRIEEKRAAAEQAEQAEAARLDALRLADVQAEAERVEAARFAKEAAAAERLEADRIEAERIEADRIEAERIEADRIEADRIEADRIEAERIEAERIEAARAEAQRLELERAAAARAEAEREESQRRAADAAAASKAREQAALAALLASATSSEDPDEELDMTGLDAELVDIFVEEGGDLLDHSDGLLARLRATPEDRETMVGLQRDLHTLKGGARMSGIMPVGELGHAMETLLEAVVAQRAEFGQDGVPLLERGFDRLHGMLTRVTARRAVGMPVGLIEEFTNRAETPLAVPEVVDDGLAFAQPVLRTIELKPLSAPLLNDGMGDDDDIGIRAPQEQVRIRADLLDRLVNYAGEVAIYRARLEQQLGAFRVATAEMEQTNIRLRDQLRRLDAETEAQIIARYQREHETADSTFDPLELDRFSTLQQLSRALAESAADLVSLHGSMDDLTRQHETLLLQQSRVSSELQEGLMRTRMVPFDALVPRLRRVIRQAAGDTGKQAQLKIEGAQGELDRNVLERMTAPLEHMLRNAVAHGLEAPAGRASAGKPEEGTIRVVVRREGSEVVLEVSDDGGGLDRKAIRARAVERGLIREEAVLGESDLDLLIVEPGFSTAETVSRLAGRGVGMDVVASEVRQLGGTLDIVSSPGRGTTFTLRLPQTLAVTQAVFVKIGETQYAVPIASVRGVGRITREEMAEQGATYRYGGEDYALHDLGQLLGASTTAKAEGQIQMPLLLVRSGELRAAVAIDQVVGNREIVVKAGGPQLASVPGIFGATIMGDGSVVVILDVAPLVRRQAAMPRDIAPVHAVVESRRVPLVMVVDDSITMRKVTGRVLERHNFEVATAKDGIDALERMVDVIPDLMLLDIEMPRMDGYELATAMKADPRMRDVPIIMITSRTGEKHRERAMELGVQRYLGKPYQEAELMRNVFDLLRLERVGDGSGS